MRFKIRADESLQRGSIHTPIVYVKQKTAWKYKQLVKDADTQPTEAELNELGEQGWELVSVAMNGGSSYMYFKRLEDEAE